MAPAFILDLLALAKIQGCELQSIQSKLSGRERLRFCKEYLTGFEALWHRAKVRSCRGELVLGVEFTVVETLCGSHLTSLRKELARPSPDEFLCSLAIGALERWAFLLKTEETLS